MIPFLHVAGAFCPLFLLSFFFSRSCISFCLTIHLFFVVVVVVVWFPFLILTFFSLIIWFSVTCLRHACLVHASFFWSLLSVLHLLQPLGHLMMAGKLIINQDSCFHSSPPDDVDTWVCVCVCDSLPLDHPCCGFCIFCIILLLLTTDSHKSFCCQYFPLFHSIISLFLFGLLLLQLLLLHFQKKLPLLNLMKASQVSQNFRILIH